MCVCVGGWVAGYKQGIIWCCVGLQTRRTAHTQMRSGQPCEISSQVSSSHREFSGNCYLGQDVVGSQLVPVSVARGGCVHPVSVQQV